MTRYNRTIQIRLTAEEKARILNKMESEGYHNLSAWLRKKLLSNSIWAEQKIDEIYRTIIKKQKENYS